MNFRNKNSWIDSAFGGGKIGSCHYSKLSLRLKGPCTFWYRENAEKMIMLRSFYKAGRWNCLKQMANTHNPMPAA